MLEFFGRSRHPAHRGPGGYLAERCRPGPAGAYAYLPELGAGVSEELGEEAK